MSFKSANEALFVELERLCRFKSANEVLLVELERLRRFKIGEQGTLS